MTANPNPPPSEKRQLSESDVRRYIVATLPQLKHEAKLNPKHRTAHLVELGERILGRIDAATLNTEQEARD